DVSIKIYVFIAVHAWCFAFSDGYSTFSMKHSGSCSSQEPVEIKLSSFSANSSGILISNFDSKFEPNLHCMVTLRPPPSYGVVVSIRFIDLQPYFRDSAACQNYLEISSVRGFKTVRLCGYSDDAYEFQSYMHWGKTNVVFHTTNSSHIQNAKFQLTFTALRKGYNWCFKEEKRCLNGHCIWKDLICDGHNNCGDLSDELDGDVANCTAVSSGESLAVILITIIGALVLLSIAAYLRGPKISQQIERMSQCRRAACPRSENIAEPDTDESPTITTVPTINRLRTYGSMEGLLSSYDYNRAPLLDPPPRYDEIGSSPPVTVTIESPSLNANEDANIIQDSS
ncbi:CUB domain-containing protein, partial [Caerostris extrusa]